MKIPLRVHMTHSLAARVREDLARWHPIATERIGLTLVRYASAYSRHVIIAVSYEPAPDDAYVKGLAAANFDARWLMRASEIATNDNCGVLWTHLHEHSGLPRFSRVDEETSRTLCPALFLACRRFPQGALVFSNDQACAQIVGNDRKLIDVAIVREVGRHRVAPLRNDASHG